MQSGSNPRHKTQGESKTNGRRSAGNPTPSVLERLSIAISVQAYIPLEEEEANGCRRVTRRIASCPELVAVRDGGAEVWLVCEQKVQASPLLGEGSESSAMPQLHRRRQHGQSGQAHQHDKGCQSVEQP